MGLESAESLSSEGRLSILIATGNAGKAREFREMLGHDRYDWSDLSSVPDAPDVEETGDTFRANACLKASAYARDAKSWALADDSGLVVDALDGKPGVYSARWAAMHAHLHVEAHREGEAPAEPSLLRASHGSAGASPSQTSDLLPPLSGNKDADNCTLLLHQLQDVPDERRTARFVCVLALANPAGDIVLTARDTVEGTILRAPRGQGGFGYDPLFFVPSLNKAMAELAPDEKHAISHRGNALKRMKRMMGDSGL